MVSLSRVLGVLLSLAVATAATTGCDSSKSSGKGLIDKDGSGGDGGGGGDGGASGGDQGGSSGAGKTSTAKTGGAGGKSTGTTEPSTPAIIVTPADGLTVSEALGTATFTVHLTTRPTSDVTIALTNSATTDLSVDQAELKFTVDDYALNKTVTLTGIDDPYDDGDTPFVIITSPAVSSDADYDGMNAPNVEGAVTDNDTAGVQVTGGKGLSTSETGSSASFTVVLTCLPKATVTMPLSVSDATEGAISKSSLIFNEANWDIPQTVTVVGVDDNLSDGSVSYDVVLGALTSGDAAYQGKDTPDVTLVNVDNDTPGFVITPTSLTTTEGGGQSFFTVALTVAPTADVTLPISSGDATEGKVSSSTLVFTPTNWQTAQSVTVTGVDDGAVDGPITYSIVTGSSVSTDAGYSGVNPADVTVVNSDNDIAGVVVTPMSGLQTNEAGKQATFTIVLSAQPTDNVTIGLSSGDTTEGTVAPSSVVFTTSNWNTPQTVTVTGVDDTAGDSSVAYSIVTAAAVSADPAYSGFNVPDVTVTNLDDEIVSPVVLVSPTSGLVTTEAGGKATFTVQLGAAPQATVGVSITTSDSTEGAVSPTTLIFTTGNWSAPQAITVTGVDDGIDDGNVNYTLVTSATVSADPAYNNLDVPDVTASNTDDDQVGITVASTGILQTTETGGTATFTVVLGCQPSGTVTIPLTSSDLTEGTVSPASLPFTTTNWNVPQKVTITGANDVLDDGDQGYSVLTGAASSTDAAYSGLDAQDVIVINTDNDPIVPCADPLMIDDMEDGNVTICGNGGRVGNWYVNDSSTTVDPTLTATLSIRGDSSVCIETTGTGISGWGETLGVTLSGTSITARLPYDVSAYTGIRFFARRGPNASYPSSVKVQIVQQNTSKILEGGLCDSSLYPSTCSDHFAYTVSVNSAWVEYQLPFASFYQSGWGRIYARDLAHVLGFEFLMAYSSFDLQIDDLRLY